MRSSVGTEQCHASAVYHLTLQQHFSKAGLVIAGKTEKPAPFRGPDRDFNPHRSAAGEGKAQRGEMYSLPIADKTS